MLTLTGLRLERAQASKQFHNGRFRNTTGIRPGMQGNTGAIMRDFFFGGKKRVPRAPLPIENPVPTWATPVDSGLRVTWLGHSTLLLEIDGVRILTDPVFGDYASPVSFAGRKRFHPVPAKLAQLPPLDAVLLSHDHYDHLCRPTIRELARMRVPFVTSLGVGERLERFGVGATLITELDWWESHLLPAGVKLTATPAQHFSGRGLTDRNATLWSSWVIETSKRKIFFSADTGLTDELATVGERLGPFDLTMLEIGASNPAWADIHLGPANAVRAFEMLGGGTLFPIHWGTFDLALHRWDEPAESLVTLAEQRGIRVITPQLGNPFEPTQIQGATPWWRGVNKLKA
ncbi:MAG TPA: MBL fold metallo-hydrolase [Gemmatimonadaceae bacterium]|nr:MBL fold metallo-hydrolase [Gemmatimonadaceae bacterium]